MRATVLAVALLWSGCYLAGAGTHFEWNQVRALRPGMSRAQVVEIMGRPGAVATRGERDILTWSWARVDWLYRTSSGAVTLEFEEDRLLEVPRIPEY